MTAALKTNCINARSDHYPTRADADAEILNRKINAAVARQARDNKREAEWCASCSAWMITTAVQRSHRPGGKTKHRRR